VPHFAAAAALLASLAGPPTETAVPAGVIKKDPVSTGGTELGGSGQFAGATPDTPNAEDTTGLNLSFGGIFNTGNARSIAMTGLGKFILRRGIHQFTAAAAGNYGRAALGVRDNPETADVNEGRSAITVGNVQGQLRYEAFFHPNFSAFLMTTARHDRFQGLDLRLNVDPGIAMYAIEQEKHKLWFEVGYDFQFDVRRDEAIEIADDLGPRPSKTLINHAVRAFAGYTNNLSEYVTFDTGLEYLQSVIVAKRFRLNWISALNVQLAKRFSLATTFTLRYENLPIPGVVRLDTITSLLLSVRII
jgi:putative salt-induced outer membrane protein YdiY